MVAVAQQVQTSEDMIIRPDFTKVSNLTRRGKDIQEVGIDKTSNEYNTAWLNIFNAISAITELTLLAQNSTSKFEAVQNLINEIIDSISGANYLRQDKRAWQFATVQMLYATKHKLSNKIIMLPSEYKELIIDAIAVEPREL